MLRYCKWNLAISKLVYKLYHWHPWFWMSRRRRNPQHEVFLEDRGGQEGRIYRFYHSFGGYCLYTTQWELRIRGGQDQQESRNKRFFYPLADNEMGKTKYTAELINKEITVRGLFTTWTIYFSQNPYIFCEHIVFGSLGFMHTRSVAKTIELL